jgi:hypothetical protein
MAFLSHKEIDARKWNASLVYEIQQHLIVIDEGSLRSIVE